MLYGAKEGTLGIHNTQMDYMTFGYGTKPLVMIQGLNTRGIKGMAPVLAYLYRIFAKEYKVYLFDRRAELSANVTVRDLAWDVAQAMDALQIANADIIGVSQGGMIAQYLAIDRPDLVHKLVLAVTLARNNNTVQSVINHWTSLTEQGKMRELVADMADKMYSERYMKRYRPMLPLLTILQTPKDVSRFITLAKACLTCNTYDDLHKITCPVLVIGARQDKIVGSSASEEIAAKLGCECYMYEGLGHAAYEEAKDFNKRVYEFLRK